MKNIELQTLAKGFTAAVVMALALPSASAAAGCDVQFRIWQDGNNTYYNHGETIVLQRGEKGDLYVHFKSRSASPYSTSADLGAPADFRVGSHRRRDVDRVLRLGRSDAGKGKIGVEAIAGGKTALGYRITAVASPGRLENIPRQCRTGQVHITVEGGSSGHTAPPPSGGNLSSGEAAQELIAGLFTGILRRQPAEVDDNYPNEWFDWVQDSGREGLVRIAEIMTTSAEFRDAAVRRTRDQLQREGVSARGLSGRDVEEHLLEDMCESLYGSYLPDEYTQERLTNTLGACLAGGQANSCQRLGRDLLNQREYADHNRRLLRHWRY